MYLDDGDLQEARSWACGGPDGAVGYHLPSHMELFSMLCRSFSLAIVSVLYDNGPMKNMKCALYGGTRHGVDDRKTHRLIEKMGLVRRESGLLRVHSLAGVLVGRSTRFYKELIKIGAGGM